MKLNLANLVSPLFKMCNDACGTIKKCSGVSGVSTGIDYCVCCDIMNSWKDWNECLRVDTLAFVGSLECFCTWIIYDISLLLDYRLLITDASIMQRIYNICCCQLLALTCWFPRLPLVSQRVSHHKRPALVAPSSVFLQSTMDCVEPPVPQCVSPAAVCCRPKPPLSSSSTTQIFSLFPY